MTIELDRAIPVLRIFSVEKAHEFYIDYLGFKVDWKHHFDANLPLYMQISRGNVVLHLSEHYGDGSPGIVVYVRMRGVAEYHAELTTKNYNYLRPGLEVGPAGGPQLNVIDPFGNRIRFSEHELE